MAGRDYNWLLATVGDWVHRTNLTTSIPDFIRFAEGTINRRLNIYAQEEEAMLVTEPGSRFVLLPADFASPIQLQSRHIEPRYTMVPVEASQMLINDDEPGLPANWAIDGENIAFNCPADRAYQLSFRYVQSLYLSATNLMTPLLMREPDLYLYGALVHSAPYIRDDARMPMWKSEFDRIMREVAAQASRSKSLAPLQTELPGSLIGSNYGGMRGEF